jgi:hypothetical protein
MEHNFSSYKLSELFRVDVTIVGEGKKVPGGPRDMEDVDGNNSSLSITRLFLSLLTDKR